MAALSDIVLYRPLEDSFEIGIKTNLSSYQPSIFNESLENYIQKKTIKNASSNVKKPEIYKTGKANKYKTEYEALLEKKIQSILPSVFSLYKNCLSGSPMNSEEKILILGKNDNIKHSSLVKNFGKLDDSSTGSIFLPHHWTLLHNDVMLIGAINAHKTIMLSLDSYPMAPENLWNSEENRPSMLGREIVILLAAGYRKLDYPYESILSYILVPGDKALADQFTLQDTVEACQGIKEHQITGHFFDTEVP